MISEPAEEVIRTRILPGANAIARTIDSRRVKDLAFIAED
jgi:hypothetical protein